MKKQPANINPYLWKRFLIKKGYNGSYRANGININVYHTSSGIFELIKDSALDVAITNNIRRLMK